MILRTTLAALLVGACCLAAESSAGNAKPTPETHPKAVSLRRLPTTQVNYEDGLVESEAADLMRVYFAKLVGSCGIPEGPIDDGVYWRINLWGGFGATDHGTLRIAKDGLKILLTPPKRGFKSSTKRALADLKIP